MRKPRHCTRGLAHSPLSARYSGRPDPAPGGFRRRVVRGRSDHAAQPAAHPLLQCFQLAFHVDEGEVAGPSPGDRDQRFDDPPDVTPPSALQDLPDTLTQALPASLIAVAAYAESACHPDSPAPGPVHRALGTVERVPERVLEILTLAGHDPLADS